MNCCGQILNGTMNGNSTNNGIINIEVRTILRSDTQFTLHMVLI